MTGERRGFTAYAFHQVAVAADRVNVVVKNVEVRTIEMLAQPLRRDSHADTVADALAQWPGCGFYARG